MIYVNPSHAAFVEDKSVSFYIDKSMLIAELNKLVCTRDKFMCVSRPRRFGKSMAGNMIAAYYSKGAGRAEDFAGLKIASDPSFDKWRGKINVIKFDLNGFLKKTTDERNLMKTINAFVLDEMKQTFDVDLSLCQTIAMAIERVHAVTGELFAIIIDEYDVLVREEKLPSNLLPDFLAFLGGLFKNADLRPAIAFAYLTGILPIVRDKIQSKMNEFTEYSMLSPKNLAPYVGFTSDEVRELCMQNGIDFAECCRWYDGYKLGKDVDVFAPKSVVEAVRFGEFDSYWLATGSYEALKQYILMDLGDIKSDVRKMISGGRVSVNTSKFCNSFHEIHTKDDVLTYLIHLGYLAYDRVAQECYIPNEEVRKEWVNSIEDSDGFAPVMERIRDSKNLLDRTIDGDEQYVAASLDKAHEQVANPLTYNKEYAMQCAIGLAYFYANTRYTVIKELPTGKGYADMVFVPYVPNTPALIVELKRNQSTDVALRQINVRDYADRLQHYRGDLLFVGINYDEKTKCHTCKIQKLKA